MSKAQIKAAGYKVGINQSKRIGYRDDLPILKFDDSQETIIYSRAIHEGYSDSMRGIA